MRHPPQMRRLADDGYLAVAPDLFWRCSPASISIPMSRHSSIRRSI
jgi:dienelactone hydrolase